MEETKPKLLIKESYLAFIKNSVGSKAYRNFYVEIEGSKRDILGDGDLSCAYFASSVLDKFNMIAGPHTTVVSTVKDMEATSGWTKVVDVSAVAPGDVIVWEGVAFESGVHKHIGFYVGDDMAVSTDSEKREVGQHDYRNAGKRGIEAIYRYDFAPKS